MAYKTKSVDLSLARYSFYNDTYGATNNPAAWGGWSSGLHGGYAGTTNRVSLIKFTIPSKPANNAAFTNIQVTVPYVRQTNLDVTSGTLYFRITTTDPRLDDKGNLKGICTVPTASNCHGSVSWSASDYNVHTSTATIYRSNTTTDHNARWSFTPGGTYYLVIGCSCNYLTIGYSGYGSLWKIDARYVEFGTGGRPDVDVIDNGDNTYKIKTWNGADAKSGTDNAGNQIWNSKRAASNLYYTVHTDLSKAYAPSTNVDSTQPSGRKNNTEHKQLSSGNNTEETPVAGSITQKTRVIADIWSYYRWGYGEHNSNTSRDQGQRSDLTIKYYAAPKTAPGTPEIRYNKSRLTIRENWKYVWTAAEQTNSDSPIAGYRITVQRKAANSSSFTTITGLTCSNRRLSKGTGTNTTVDSESSTCDITFDPKNLGFAPGDKVKLSIKAYSKDGKGTKKVLNITKTSAESLVQNAGIVHVNIGTAEVPNWKEGIAYVYDGTAWKEAETVNIYDGTNWREST